MTDFNSENITPEQSSKSRLRRLMTTVVIVFTALVIYFLTIGYFGQLSEAENASLMRLAGIANTLSLQIDGDAHQRLMEHHRQTDAIQSSQQDSDYLKIHLILQRNYDANMLKTPVYTIILDSSNTCFFGVTSAEMPYFRHPYHSAPALLMEKHAEGAMIPRYTDEFGTWLSAFAAVRNSKNEMVALVQVDQRFDEFIATARSGVIKNLVISMIGCSVLFFLLLQFLQPIVRKENQIKEALEEANQKNQQINIQLQESLEQITELDGFRKEMIANLSHDLRTPMASILGYLETIILKKNQISPTEKDHFLHVALTEANRLNRLLSDLFDLSKLESGQIHIQPEPFNVAELAQDTFHKYQLQADQKQVKLMTDFSESVPLAAADVRWIDRVLQNLLDNALRYVPEGGFVMFTVFEQKNKIHVKVCNSGTPIPEAHLTKVFERYFKSANRKKDSTGLGLTIVKKIMALHGEAVWAESGDDLTTFRFTLPIYSHPV